MNPVSAAQPSLRRTGERFADRLDEIRSVFDQSFARPAVASAQETTALILVRAGGQPLALPCTQILGLHRARRLTPMPSRAPELLGLAGLRGALLPVYSLAALIGLPAENVVPAWMVEARAGGLVGLAFERFEGQVLASPEQLSAAAPPQTGMIVQLPEAPRPVPDLASALDALRSRLASPEFLPKE